ncbi:MAG: 16S rRNA (guanine(527)-N(7))-methyltransferase RsmG [Candidatus Caccovivens sp.]
MKNLAKIFENYGINLSNEQEAMFDKYFSMLIETNKLLNLTAITDEDDVAIKHFLDSVLPHEFFQKDVSVVDVGSGAGFPALPLKILRQDLNITMVDSLNKRVNFLNEVIRELNLQKIFAVHARAEEFAVKNREKFDIAVARAVAGLNTLVEYLLPLIKIGGCAIIYKSTKLNEELLQAKKAIEILGGKVEEVKNYKIKEADLERNILIIRKIQKTPSKYPRDKNKPKLSPIK